MLPPSLWPRTSVWVWYPAVLPMSPSSLVGASQPILVEDINDACGITANTNAVIDVYGGEDYAGEDGLVSDYASTLSLAEDLGLGLVSSGSAHVIDVYGGEDRGKQRCEESHVLGLMGRTAGYQTQTDSHLRGHPQDSR
jgi:hypothetical protein